VARLEDTQVLFRKLPLAHRNQKRGSTYSSRKVIKPEEREEYMNQAIWAIQSTSRTRDAQIWGVYMKTYYTYVLCFSKNTPAVVLPYLAWYLRNRECQDPNDNVYGTLTLADRNNAASDLAK
jgi:hypothetical protein